MSIFQVAVRETLQTSSTYTSLTVVNDIMWRQSRFSGYTFLLKYSSRTYLVGHISWPNWEIAFNSIFFQISLDKTNVIRPLSTDFWKSVPKVPKSGGKFWSASPIGLRMKVSKLKKYLYQLIELSILNKKYKNTYMKKSSPEEIRGLQSWKIQGVTYFSKNPINIQNWLRNEVNKARKAAKN